MPSHPSDEDLLLARSGELESGARASVAAHLAACAPCRAREEALGAAAASAFDALEEHDRAWSFDRDERRMRLANRMADASRNSVGRSLRFASAAIAATIALAIGLTFRDPAADRILTPHVEGETGARPIASLTPGAVIENGRHDVCESRSLQPLTIPASVRQQVLRDYGMEDVPEHEFELDYLVTPALGGIPDARNLWPERYTSPVWNARVKDELEELLPQLVCEGKVELATAQREIASDWIAAYKKYFRTDRPLRSS
jgi:hypothetical protein